MFLKSPKKGIYATSVCHNKAQIRGDSFEYLEKIKNTSMVKRA